MDYRLLCILYKFNSQLMKIIVHCAAVLMILTSCAKIDTGKTTAPVSNKTTPANAVDSRWKGCKTPLAASFAGGMAAWRQFLSQHLIYPASAVNATIQGTVVVHFDIYEDGSLHNIKAFSGPKELRQSAIDVVKKSPTWIPASIEGYKVRFSENQPIAFKLEAE